MKTWSHKTWREGSAASLSGQHGLKRAARGLAGQWVARASGAWQYGFLYSNTPLQTDGSFYHQFVQNSKLAGNEIVEAA
jgi:hypothetical protein